MELSLLRHADADTIAERDDDRPLSEKGEAQSRKVARFCSEHGIKNFRLLASPLLRTLQTAEIVGAHLEVPVEIAPWLASGMRPLTALARLQEIGASESALLIVGHEPDLSALVAHLLGLTSGELIEIRKASLTRLTVRAWEKGGARLDFSVPCRLM